MVKMNWILTAAMALTVLGCQKPHRPTTQTMVMASFAAGPQLVRIPITAPTQADSLMQLGFDVIVIEKDYLIARLDSAGAIGIQSMNLNMVTIQESDLVQRLIRVIMTQKSDLAELSNTGIDIWQVHGDTVVAQAYDKYIRQIRQKGYSVEIVTDNIRNLVPVEQQKEYDANAKGEKK